MRNRLWLGWLGISACGLFLWGVSAGIFSMATFSGASVARAAAAPDEELKDLEKEPAKAAAPAKTNGNGKADEEVLEKKSFLSQMFEALGVFYTLAFLALSFTFVALVVMNGLAARRDSIVPLHLVEAFEAHLNDKKYQEAYDLAKQDESFLGRVLSAGLAKLSAGYEPAIEAMQEVGEDENMKLEHRLSYIAIIGTVSPMVGLLGTVDGMIQSFSEIAIRSTAPPPPVLAKGIATALFTTLVGLWIAIPAVAAYSLFKNRFARLVLEVGILSEGLMSRFSAVGTKKP